MVVVVVVDVTLIGMRQARSMPFANIRVTILSESKYRTLFRILVNRQKTSLGSIETMQNQMQITQIK